MTTSIQNFNPYSNLLEDIKVTFKDLIEYSKSISKQEYEEIDCYRLVSSELLPSGKYRHQIRLTITYDIFSIRTKEKYTLREILDMVYQKYGVELWELEPKYIIELFEEE